MVVLSKKRLTVGEAMREGLFPKGGGAGAHFEAQVGADMAGAAPGWSSAKAQRLPQCEFLGMPRNWSWLGYVK